MEQEQARRDERRRQAEFEAEHFQRFKPVFERRCEEVCGPLGIRASIVAPNHNPSSNWQTFWVQARLVGPPSADFDAAHLALAPAGAGWREIVGGIEFPMCERFDVLMAATEVSP
jgi:hypothetical protein